MDSFNVNLDMFASNTNRLIPDIPYVSEYPDDEARAVNGLAYTPKDSDVIYCFPPYALRVQAVNRIASFSNPVVFVLTIQDQLKQDLTVLFSNFEYYIRLGPNYKATIRPSDTLVKLDDQLDYFTTYDKVVETILLIKGMDSTQIDWFELNLRPLLQNSEPQISPFTHFIDSFAPNAQSRSSGFVKDLKLLV